MRVHLHSTVLALTILPTPVHQEGGVVELTQLRTANARPTQPRFVSSRQPLPVLRRPSAICHGPRHAQKLISITAIRLPLQRVHTIMAVIQAPNLLQDDTILELFADSKATVRQILRRDQLALIITPPPTTAFVCTVNVLRIIANRLALLRITRLQHILPTKAVRTAPIPARAPTQHLIRPRARFPKHLTTDHA